MNQQQPTPGSFDLGGSDSKSFSFGPQGAQPGAEVIGTVLEMAEVQKTNFDTRELEFWPNGDPKMQYRVTLQTAQRDPQVPTDDGKRDLYLDGRRRANDNGTKSRLCAVLDAVRATTGGTELKRGGTLRVKWISGMGFSGDPRNYEASYTPPAMNLDQQQPAQPVQQGAPAQAFQQPMQQAPAFAQPAPAQAPQDWPQQQAAPTQQPVQQPVQQAAPVIPAGPTPEQLAAVRALGVDPAVAFPGYTG